MIGQIFAEIALHELKKAAKNSKPRAPRIQAMWIGGGLLASGLVMAAGFYWR